MLGAGDVAWEAVAAAEAAGDAGGEKEIGGCSGDGGWDGPGTGRGRAFKGRFGAATCGR